jgi:subtilisin-like proprotein convertase family protein
MRPRGRTYLLTAFLSVSLMAAVVGTAGGALATGKGKAAALRQLLSDPHSGAFLNREIARKAGGRGGVPPSGNPTNRIAPAAVNDPAADTTAQDTQSETSVAAIGSKAVIAFNDSGSNVGGQSHFTGYAFTSTGGLGWTDAGTLPASAAGDAGDPVLAADTGTGAFYLSTLGFNTDDVIQVFKSTDGGQTWGAPVNGVPGFANPSMDKEWMAVDNFVGTGRHNIYLCATNFGVPTPEIRLTSSVDGGATFGPSGGTLISSGGQGCYVAVGPDHSVYVFYYRGTGAGGQGGDNKLFVRKSTDQGASFAPEVQVADLNTTTVNGGLGLNGGFRSNSFPHAAINPVSGHIVVVYNDDPSLANTADNGDIYYTRSTNGGSTWSAPIRVNDIAIRDQYMPTVAISTDGTRIVFGYYSRDHDTSNLMFHRQSRLGTMNTTTGGITLNKSFQLGPDTPPVIGQDPVINPTYMGDYDQIAATPVPNAFYMSWADDRSGNAFHPYQPDVRFARIATPETTADVGVTVNPSPASINLGQNTTITVNVTATGATASDVFLNVNRVTGLAIQSVNAGTGRCELIAQLVGCSLGSIAAGSSKSVQIVATGALVAGTRTVFASATTSSKDTNGANNSASANVVVSTGSAVTKTYSTGSVAIPIPDNTTVNVPLTLADEATVVRAIPRIRLNHTFDSDLRITLISPTGKSLVLSNRRGASGDNFGSGANDCTGTKTSFDDLAATPISAGAPPFAGTFKPDQPLSDMVSEPNDGVWTLRIQDLVSGDTGTLGCFQLTTTRVP